MMILQLAAICTLAAFASAQQTQGFLRLQIFLTSNGQQTLILDRFYNCSEMQNGLTTIQQDLTSTAKFSAAMTDSTRQSISSILSTLSNCPNLSNATITQLQIDLVRLITNLTQFLADPTVTTDFEKLFFPVSQLSNPQSVTMAPTTPTPTTRAPMVTTPKVTTPKVTTPKVTTPPMLTLTPDIVKNLTDLLNTAQSSTIGLSGSLLTNLNYFIGNLTLFLNSPSLAGLSQLIILGNKLNIDAIANNNLPLKSLTESVLRILLNILFSTINSPYLNQALLIAVGSTNISPEMLTSSLDAAKTPAGSLSTTIPNLLNLLVDIQTDATVKSLLNSLISSLPTFGSANFETQLSTFLSKLQDLINYLKIHSTSANPATISILVNILRYLGTISNDMKNKDTINRQIGDLLALNTTQTSSPSTQPKCPDGLLDPILCPVDELIGAPVLQSLVQTLFGKPANSGTTAPSGGLLGVLKGLLG